MIEIKTYLFHELDCHTSINNCKHKSHGREMGNSGMLSE